MGTLAVAQPLYSVLYEQQQQWKWDDRYSIDIEFYADGQGRVCMFERYESPAKHNH
jgi:hypothetical protein